MTSLFRRICERLGISWVWWQWRWINFKNRLAFTFSMNNNVFRRLGTTQKVCRCGGLAAGGDRTCQRCGNTLPSAVSYFFYKIFGLVLPGVHVATAILSGLIFLVFAVELMAGGITAVLAPDRSLLMKLGALYGPSLYRGQWWRLFTYMFLHIGIIHLAFNAFAMLSVSHFLEEEIGFHRYISVYLLTGIGAALVSVQLRAYAVPSAGASGAIFGLIGFSIGYFHRVGGPRGREVTSFMVRWAVYAFMFGLFVGADNLAHAGGFVTGLALGYVMEIREDQKRRWSPAWRALAIVLGTLLALSFGLLVRSLA